MSSGTLQSRAYVSSGSADTSVSMTQSVMFSFSLPRCLHLVLLMSTSVCCCYSHLKIYYSGEEGVVVGSSCGRVKVSSSFTAHLWYKYLG